MKLGPCLIPDIKNKLQILSLGHWLTFWLNHFILTCAAWVVTIPSETQVSYRFWQTHMQKVELPISGSPYRYSTLHPSGRYPFSLWPEKIMGFLLEIFLFLFWFLFWPIGFLKTCYWISIDLWIFQFSGCHWFHAWYDFSLLNGRCTMCDSEKCTFWKLLLDEMFCNCLLRASGLTCSLSTMFSYWLFLS